MWGLFITTILLPLARAPCDASASLTVITCHHRSSFLVYAGKIPVIARLIKPVVVVRQDVPSVVETLAAGVMVDFEPGDGVAEVVCDGKAYLVMVKELLDAAHPARWERD